MGRPLDTARALYLEAIRDGDYEAAIEAYSGERYTQHSTPVRDGKEGFKEFFAEFVKRNPVRDIQIVRSFEDGRFVFLHVLQWLNHGEFQYVTADIFDTDDDARLIEHWDIIEELGPANPSGRTALDGPTEPTDLDATEANKALVARFVDEVLVAGDHARMPTFVASDVAQHRAGLADGVEAAQRHARDASLRYVEVHRLIGAGDLVAVLSEVEARGVRRAVIDLFRVADGLIAEHWDVSEDITPEETWVNSGKF